MTYQKQQWTNEALSGPPRYNIKLTDGTILTNVEIQLATPIAQAGTNITAARMNHIETGIEAVSQIATGLKILGFYDTVSALEAAVENPAAGDAYGVGTAYPYDIYVYSETALWVNMGKLQGAPGTIGVDGQSAYDVWLEQGNTGTKAEFLASLKGDKGDAAFTVAIGTVTTGAAGSDASVVNSGTAGAQVWDLTIPRGAKGEKGDTGNPGTPGAKGDPGDDGAAATISIGTVTTGAAGTSASVTNSGTENNAVLNFIIPQGAQGIPGSVTSHNHDGTDSPKVSYTNLKDKPTIPVVPDFETSASNIKADGTASVGSLSTIARADHIHPANFESSAANIKPDGAVASVGTLNTFARADHIHPGTPLNFETSTDNIKPNGTASVGTLNTVARADHVHPGSSGGGADMLSIFYF